MTCFATRDMIQINGAAWSMEREGCLLLSNLRCWMVALPGCVAWYRNLYTKNMKTTLNINDQLLADAKGLAVRQRTSLTRLIEEGLQLRLRASAISRVARKSAAPAIPVYHGKGGLTTGIDPLSNKSLLAAMESDGGLK